jgi:hypothetical protein
MAGGGQEPVLVFGREGLGLGIECKWMLLVSGDRRFFFCAQEDEICPKNLYTKHTLAFLQLFVR